MTEIDHTARRAARVPPIPLRVTLTSAQRRLPVHAWWLHDLHQRIEAAYPSWRIVEIRPAPPFSDALDYDVFMEPRTEAARADALALERGLAAYQAGEFIEVDDADL